MDREVGNTGIRIECSAKDQMAADPELQKDLAMFTWPKGREKTSWTELSVSERIEVVHRKHGPRASGGLEFALHAMYRHGSEIAHGSLFGALFSLGLTMPGRPKSIDELEGYMTQGTAFVLRFVCRAVESLAFVYEKETGTTGFYERCEALLDSLAVDE
jgi:hypothetical protein